MVRVRGEVSGEYSYVGSFSFGGAWMSGCYVLFKQLLAHYYWLSCRMLLNITTLYRLLECKMRVSLPHPRGAFILY